MPSTDRVTLATKGEHEDEARAAEPVDVASTPETVAEPADAPESEFKVALNDSASFEDEPVRVTVGSFPPIELAADKTVTVDPLHANALSGVPYLTVEAV